MIPQKLQSYVAFLFMRSTRQSSPASDIETVSSWTLIPVSVPGECFYRHIKGFGNSGKILSLTVTRTCECCFIYFTISTPNITQCTLIYYYQPSTFDYTLNVKYAELLDLTSVGYSSRLVLPTPSRNMIVGGSKIRLGFLSSFFFRHSVGKLLGNVIMGLSKSNFEIFIIELAVGASQTGILLKLCSFKLTHYNLTLNSYIQQKLLMMTLMKC